ncbi:MAG: hypothetical protein AB7O67_16460 [Vicinamibacterales bacterium]
MTHTERDLLERLVRCIHEKYGPTLTYQHRKMAAVEVEQVDQLLGATLLARVEHDPPIMTVDDVMTIATAEIRRN